MTSESWYIRLFGGLQVRHGTKIVERFRTEKTATLLAYLALHGGKSWPREVLADMLWRESPGENARGNLRGALCSLRKDLEGADSRTLLLADRKSLALNAACCTTDLVLFESALERAARAGGDEEKIGLLAEATDLYGEFLTGLYADWVLTERSRLEEMYFQAARALAEALHASGESERAVAELRRAIGFDPMCEQIYDDLIALHAALGDKAAALCVAHDRDAVLRRLGCPTAGLNGHAPTSATPVSKRGAALLPVPETPPIATLPTGTVTFLFAEIDESAAPVKTSRQGAAAIARHLEIVCSAVSRQRGFRFGCAGSPLRFAFARPADAVRAAAECMRSLEREKWLPCMKAKTKMALHTGTPVLLGSDYSGPEIKLAAAALAAGHPNQILLTDSTHSLLYGGVEETIGLVDLGLHCLDEIRDPVRFYQLTVEGLPASPLPLRTAGRPHNLPRGSTALLGREREIEEARGLLAEESVRLLTLQGAGGSGKSRLSIEIAHALLPDFRDGCRFVALAAVSDPALLPLAIAGAAEMLSGSDTASIGRLCEHLRGKELLLVIDNFEHLLSASATVHELLAHCPGIKALVTSRARLDVHGERVLPVLPLCLPEGWLADPEVALESAPVRLFQQRARSVRPDFRISRENIEAVCHICARVDCLPLAIELAAARVNVLPPPVLSGLLMHDLRALGSAPRDLPDRQRTMEAAIGWSYGLLSEGERRTLRRLSVFAGGWSFAAAGAVCLDDPGEDVAVLDQLGALVDWSMLTMNEQGRFGVLETIREYAFDRLCESGELEAMRRRHCEYFVAAGEDVYIRFPGSHSVAACRYLEADLENLRRAMLWSMEADRTLALRLLTATCSLWLSRPYPDWNQWLETVVHQDFQGPGMQRGRAALHLGTNSGNREILMRSRDIYRGIGEENGATWAEFQGSGMIADAVERERVLRIVAADFEKQNDPCGLGLAKIALGALGNLPEQEAATREAVRLLRKGRAEDCLFTGVVHLAHIEMQLGNLEAAKALGEEAVELRRILGWINFGGHRALIASHLGLNECGGIVDCLDDCLMIAHRSRDPGALVDVTIDHDTLVSIGEYERMISVGESNLGLARAHAHPLGLCRILRGLGASHCALGTEATARERLREALEYAEKAGGGADRAMASIHLALGQVEQRFGSATTAHSHYAASLDWLGREENSTGGITRGSILEAFGCLAMDSGRFARSARLWGATEWFHEQSRYPNLLHRDREVKPKLPELRAALGERALGRHWREGRAMGIEQAVAYALEDRR